MPESKICDNCGYDKCKCIEPFKSDKLLPCPFCGNQAQIENMPSRRQYFIICVNELCRSSTANWSNKNRAIEAWNKRHH